MAIGVNGVHRFFKRAKCVMAVVKQIQSNKFIPSERGPFNPN